ncbi:hypothetical protein SCHPADRAFT_936944 [Schizopora paradoxa]|uniref:Uncharacterized protein n=1 Tax=Schizopora paradoxa TaxID=27342 RepID=A0A0H2RZR2_9AGAM|nr:hypothetical protein SCHPADRAFT_936944 [Schizopora paradoxa]
MKPALRLLALTTCLFLQAYAIDDLGKACLDGTCSFGVEDSEGTSNTIGTFEISGPSSAISDITPAAGWKILNCTDSTNTQTIQLVCVDESLGCAHLFLEGAEDTVVRLPEGCGIAPFARVAKYWIPEDQSVAPNPVGLSGTLSQVHNLKLDDDFIHASGSHGNVSFSFSAQSDMVVDNSNIDIGERRKRQLFSGSASANRSVSFTNSSLIFNQTLSCPDSNVVDGAAAITVKVNELEATFNMTINVSAAGTLIPTSFTSFNFSVPTNASIQGFITPQSSMQSLTPATATVPLANVTLPQMLIVNIIAINPTFTANATSTVTARNQTNFQSTTFLDFGIENLQFNFSTVNKNTNSSVDVLTPSVPISASIQPNIASSASFDIDFTSALNLLVIAFGTISNASVTYDFGLNVGMTSSSILGILDFDMNVCTNISSFVAANISHSGILLGPAATIPLFNQTSQLLNVCVETVSEPTPLSRRSAALSKRAVFTCPAFAPIAENPVVITAMSG